MKKQPQCQSHKVHLPGARKALIILFFVISGCGSSSESGENGETSSAPRLSEAEVFELARTLTGSDPGAVTGSSAYRTLASAGRVAQGPLIQILQDTSEETDVRKWAARLLGSVGQFDVVLPVLLKVFEDLASYSWWHRTEASHGLRALWRRQSVDFRLRYFSDQNPIVRRTVAQSFRFEMTADNRAERVHQALLDLALYDGDRSVRSGALSALIYMVKTTDDIGPYLQILANDSDDWIRGDAATALGEIGNRAATQPLIDALARTGQSTITIGDIVMALGRIGDARAVEPLLQTLFLPEIQASRWAQQDVVEALGLLQDPRAVDPLIQLLAQSADTYVRREVMEALGTIGDVRAVQPIIVILQDLTVDYFERAVAADALGDIGDSSAIPALEYARDNDPDSYVRSRAESALEAIQSVGS